MSCLFPKCAFRDGSSPSDCEQLCKVCHIKQFAKGQILSGTYWKGSVVQVLEGVLLDMKLLIEDHPVTVAVHAPGSLYGLEKIFDRAEDADDSRVSYCLTSCTVAVYSAEEMHELIRVNHSLSHPILKESVLNQMQDKTDMLIYLGFGDAKASVGYVMRYLERHGLNDLTHEQIALICNRSRQTVTTVLKQLDRDDAGFADAAD